MFDAAKTLTDILDQSGVPPRAVLWVHTSEPDRWRLWIAPHAEMSQHDEFYSRMFDLVAANRKRLFGLDLSQIELVSPDHPAIRGLREYPDLDGLEGHSLDYHLLNGYYVPEGVVVRVAA